MGSRTTGLEAQSRDRQTDSCCTIHLQHHPHHCISHSGLSPPSPPLSRTRHPTLQTLAGADDGGLSRMTSSLRATGRLPTGRQQRLHPRLMEREKKKPWTLEVPRDQGQPRSHTCLCVCGVGVGVGLWQGCFSSALIKTMPAFLFRSLQCISHHNQRLSPTETLELGSS